MKLLRESQLLDKSFRAAVIKEILSPENSCRKSESLKRYEVYKDQALKHVIKALEAEGLKPETIEQMKNRASNISLCRKVVNKLARTYSGGVSRDAGSDAVNVQISELARLLSFDEKMKKGDRYRELQKNMMFQIVPEGVGDPDDLGENAEYRLVMRCLLPWSYDVIEDYRDREVARCVVLSDYFDENVTLSAASEHDAGFHYSSPRLVKSNQKDDIIADHPRDANMGKKRRFVWWSSAYHFTTDEAGEILDDSGNPEHVNPIGMLPFVTNAEDQDGQFWSMGGDDLIHGSILVNKQITDMNFIAYLQGYGQYVITGKNLQDSFIVGVNNAIMMEYNPDNGDPKPEVSVVSANPPLGDWMAMIEQYVALLLTTNNLSPGNVAMKLDANTFPSGIALMIEKSEATDDISDKQKSYQDQERVIWRVISRWVNLYLEAGQLAPEFSAIGRMPDDIDVRVTFNDIKPVFSEKEKLEAIKLRKDLGLDTEIDLILRDNPNMTYEEAEAKLLKIKGERLERAAAFGLPVDKKDEAVDDQDEDDEDDAN